MDLAAGICGFPGISNNYVSGGSDQYRFRKKHDKEEQWDGH